MIAPLPTLRPRSTLATAAPRAKATRLPSTTVRRKIAFVVFAVDERLTGRMRVTNEEVVQFAEQNSDIAIPFASIDPNRGADRLWQEAKRLVSEGRVRGLKLHPPVQKFIPNDPLAYPLYEVFAEARLPVIFHTGHSGLGTGMPGGGGVRLKYGHPMPIDDVAVDFPTMPIIMAHPSFPWQDEAISICLHKPNVYIDLSGWSPKYFRTTLIQYANTTVEEQGSLRIRLSFDHPGPLAGGLRQNRHPRRSPASDP